MEDKNDNNLSVNLFAMASKELEEEEKQNSDSFSSESMSSVNNIFAMASSELDKGTNSDELKSDINDNSQDAIIDDGSDIVNEITSEETNPFVQKNVVEEVSNVENQVAEDVPEATFETNPFVQKNVVEEVSNVEEQVVEDVPEATFETNPFFAGNSLKQDESNVNVNPFFKKDIELNETHKHVGDKEFDFSDVQHFKVKIQKKKPRKLKFILGVLSYALFIWLVLIGGVLLIYVANIKIKQLKGDYTPPKYNAYVVLTGSMLQEIKIDDVVITKKIDAKDLEEGDIITFASSDERFYGTIITHRIKKKYYDSTTKKYTFVSKGDNNNVEDMALVEQDKIYGKVILKIPKLGYLQKFLASRGGWILVILLPCLTVISFDIMKLFKVVGRKSKIKIAR